MINARQAGGSSVHDASKVFGETDGVRKPGKKKDQTIA